MLTELTIWRLRFCYRHLMLRSRWQTFTKPLRSPLRRLIKKTEQETSKINYLPTQFQDNDVPSTYRQPHLNRNNADIIQDKTIPYIRCLALKSERCRLAIRRKQRPIVFRSTPKVRSEVASAQPNPAGNVPPGITTGYPHGPRLKTGQRHRQQKNRPH